MLGGPWALAVPGEGEADSSSPIATPDQAVAGFAIPSDFRVELFAAEPELANPVAFAIDERGRVFVCETFRQGHGVSDNRGQTREWVDADLASQSVADREAYHRRLLGPKLPDWELHDDRVRLLVDRDRDGRADESTVYAAGFNRLIDGTAAGLLARHGDLFLTCIPALYRLRDLDGDGQIARSGLEREVLSEGYGCRVAFRGHDLHGLVLGPDCRLYFTIGDRGYQVEHAGGVAAEPGRGAVFRCRPDGSEFEVFATGLRNPQELAFDDLGNLFTVDNNSDGGDRARLVHLLPGGDSGWTMEYQYLSDRGPWNRERLWELPHEGQPAWIVPPLAHLGAGPSGLAAYPGTGMPERFAGRFLICDFRGGSVGSSVRSFALEPAGGSFRVILDEETFRNVLATDVEFGPDGAIWVSDWVHGWYGEGRGRLWRFLPRERDEVVVSEVQSLLATDWTALDRPQLIALLGHADRRLRFEAQWELTRRGEREALMEIVTAEGPLLRRVHGIWGLAAVSDGGARPAAVAPLVECLSDPSWEIRSVACRTLGDLAELESAEALDRLASLINDSHPHVRVAAGVALGRLGDRSLNPAALDRILAAASQDLEADGFLRHGIVSAMAGGFDAQALGRAAEHPDGAVRLAACLAMRRLRDERIVGFLDDDEPSIAAEAVRAIHDLPLSGLFEPLARALTNPQPNRELARRMVSAAERLGTPAAAQLLATAAANPALPDEARVMALEVLADWAFPPSRNRVDGRWQPHAEARDPAVSLAALEPVLTRLLAGQEGPIRHASLAALTRLNGEDVITLLTGICRDPTWEAAARGASLDALTLKDLQVAGQLAPGLLQDPAPLVRAAARRTLAATNPVGVVADIARLVADQATDLGERQAAVDLLATIEDAAAAILLTTLVGRLEAGDLDPALALEVREAAAGRLGRSVTLSPGIVRTKSAVPRSDDAGETVPGGLLPLIAGDEDSLAEWGDAVAGGDGTRGRELFFGKVEVSCVRCHQAEGTGGVVGPQLDGIGARKDARYLLESLVRPDAQVADGFQTMIVITDEGRAVSGIVVSEDNERLTLRSAEGELLTLQQDEIDERVAGPSSMPADLVSKLSRRELRDLVAWLGSLRAEDEASLPASLP
jgi:quinoprotein glucose dehydrogenase